jgi:hypothetical protein
MHYAKPRPSPPFPSQRILRVTKHRDRETGFSGFQAAYSEFMKFLCLAVFLYILCIVTSSPSLFLSVLMAVFYEQFLQYIFWGVVKVVATFFSLVRT